MEHAGCVFVAGIYPSRTWTSGSFESERWNACVHRLDLGLYSHPKEFLESGVRTHVNCKGKIPSTGRSWTIKRTMLHLELELCIGETFNMWPFNHRTSSLNQILGVVQFGCVLGAGIHLSDDVNARILMACVVKVMHTQTAPWITFSSKGVESCTPHPSPPPPLSAVMHGPSYCCCWFVA